MEITQDPSGASDVQASGDVATEVQTDSVPSGHEETIKLSTHKKLLGERKADRVKLESALSELNSLREERLMSEGKKDELIEKYKNDLEEYKGKYTSAIGNYGFSVISNKVREAALKHGCIDVDGLINLTDLSSINCDEDFQVDDASIEGLVSSFKKARPHFFKTENINLKDGVLRKPEVPSTYEEDLKSCKTQKELEAVMKKHGRM